MNTKIDARTIIKLGIWSFLVGFILYSINLSPGEVYGWALNMIAGVWDWLASSGLQYILLGATIVIPVFLISRFRKRS